MIEWRIFMRLFNSTQEMDLTFRAKGLNHAKQRVLQEVKSQLPEKKRLYLEAKGAGVYTIVSDLEDIGEAILKHENN